jgi:hypothetical protein
MHWALVSFKLVSTGGHFIGAAGSITKTEMQPLEGKIECQSWCSVTVAPRGIVELSPTTVYHCFELMLCV